MDKGVFMGPIVSFKWMKLGTLYLVYRLATDITSINYSQSQHIRLT